MPRPVALAAPRPEDDSAKRRQIIDGARKVFMDLGFDGASMGEIARAAGVSKGTLYVYFADKNSLFESIVEEEILEQKAEAGFNFDPARDAETTLTEFGHAYIRVLCRPGGGSAIRTVMAIAERMPDVGKRFYDNVIADTIHKLEDYVAARVAVGEIQCEDCHLAASQFMMTCQASLFMPFVFQAAPAPSADDMQRVVTSATQLFLARYRA